jgi:hypothetical protein
MTIQVEGIDNDLPLTGGGFCIPILDGHVKFLGKTMEKVKANGRDLTVAVLEYSTPGLDTHFELHRAGRC